MRRPFISFPPGISTYVVLAALVVVLTPIDLWMRCRYARQLRRESRTPYPWSES